MNVCVSTHVGEEASQGPWFGRNRPTEDGTGEGHTQSGGKPSIQHRATDRQSQWLEKGGGGQVSLQLTPTHAAPHDHIHTFTSVIQHRGEVWGDNQTAWQEIQVLLLIWEHCLTVKNIIWVISMYCKMNPRPSALSHHQCDSPFLEISPVACKAVS